MRVNFLSVPSGSWSLRAISVGDFLDLEKYRKSLGIDRVKVSRIEHKFIETDSAGIITHGIKLFTERA